MIDLLQASRCVVSAGVGLFFGVSSSASLAQQEINAVVIDHGHVVLSSSDEMDSYIVRGGARLTANGAAIKSLYLQESRVDLNAGADVSEGVIGIGAGVLKSEKSTIRNNNGIALLVQNGYEAVLGSSLVSGGGMGVSVSLGSLVVYNSDVIGERANGWRGWGVGMFGGKAEVGSKSYVEGTESGIFIGNNAVGDGSSRPHYNFLQIDDSTVRGVEGASIRVESYEEVPLTAEIDIRNNSTLLTGNGNLLESLNQSTAQLSVDNSTLIGHLVADETSTLNVTLQNHARLTGNIVNGNAVSINSGGYWQMMDDNAIKSLSLHGGTVNFGDGDFKTLSLDQLSGNGTFAMRIDLDQDDGDWLDVQGQANGQFGLRVRNTGVEAVSPDREPLLLVHTEGGNAQFNLIGGRVDLGAYSYELEQQDNDWFIVGNNRTISPSTASVLALFNAGPTIWMSELSTLRSRMGEVRTTGLGGGWMRGYGNRFEATTGDGVDYKQKQQGFSLGADAPVPVSNGNLSLGVMAGHSQSDLDLSRGTSGKVDSLYVGTYATWLSDEGYYLDAVLKLNRLRNKSKVAMSDNTKAKGNYDNTGIGGSVEFGKHIKLADDWFIEPYAQLAAVTLKGERYRLDNGLQASNNQTHSVLGKVGSTLGRDIALKDGGVLQPYVRVALVQEFSRNNDVKVNDSHFDNDLSGSRAELGAGVSVSLSRRLQLHADFDYMNGKQVKQPWGANVGLRLAF